MPLHAAQPGQQAPGHVSCQDMVGGVPRTAQQPTFQKELFALVYSRTHRARCITKFAPCETGASPRHVAGTLDRHVAGEATPLPRPYSVNTR